MYTVFIDFYIMFSVLNPIRLSITLILQKRKEAQLLDDRAGHFWHENMFKRFLFSFGLPLKVHSCLMLGALYHFEIVYYRVS